MLSEKEEDHLKKEEKLLQHQRLLEETIATLSGVIAAYKETQAKIIPDCSDKVNDTLTQIDTFNMKFEEDTGHLESRIYEILNELKVALNLIKVTGEEKKQVKKEIDTPVQQLKDEKECASVLKEKVEQLENREENEVTRRGSLTETVNQLEEKIATLHKIIAEKDEKMGEYERKMNDKDKGMLDLSEENREAIRKLCIWIDYHQSHYDDLIEMISKARGRRQVAA